MFRFAVLIIYLDLVVGQIGHPSEPIPPIVMGIATGFFVAGVVVPSWRELISAIKRSKP